MSGQSGTCDFLPLGQTVLFRRKNGEKLTGRIISAPIPHLLPFGEFYMVGRIPTGPEPFWRGSGRKSKERLAWEADTGALGMYERRQMEVIGNA